jgi:hypothetical protein
MVPNACTKFVSTDRQRVLTRATGRPMPSRRHPHAKDDRDEDDKRSETEDGEDEHMTRTHMPVKGTPTHSARRHTV